MLIERIGAVSGYNSHKEIDFGSKLALPALLADFRYNYINEQDVTIRGRSQIHYGTAKLRYKEEDDTLEGNYWTDRKSVGDIFLTRIKQ